ncbi:MULTISPECIES: hypothetical protein [unclassified Micromonospora]|uniref:hypothetical protein n=1 Tax=unclassified Micromonospora TaxID=2617518 RepID=UPI00331AF881
MIHLWHASTHAGSCVQKSDPLSGGPVGLVTDLVERPGASGADVAVAGDGR